jgi:hypothetical protein
VTNLVKPIKPNIGAVFRRRRVGSFRDEAAYVRYREAYDRAMADLPEPTAVWDLATCS